VQQIWYIAAAAIVLERRTPGIRAESIEHSNMSAGERVEEQEEKNEVAAVQSNYRLASSDDCLEPGSVFGSKYRIVKLLGQGGMSSVYKAEDIMLKRMVALKLLHPRYLNSENAILRFWQEARAASKLKHSGIVTIHDFGVPEDGQPFLVMDYIDGVSLADEIASSGPLPLPRLIHIVSDICDALAEAHKHRIVHRDIKPSNIMLMRSGDGSDRIKIVDFGIAKVGVEDAADQLRLTQSGEVFGSPPYMSPEQCLGQKIDTRSDIYALGCVLYEGLCGHPPFAGDNALATIQQHITAEPAPIDQISEADGKQVSEMQKILLCLLAKDRDQRYQNVAAIKQDLAEVLAGRNVRIDISRRLQRRHRLALLMVPLVAIAVLVFIWQSWLHPSSQPTSVQQTIRLSEEQQRQVWATEDLAGQKDFDQGRLQSANVHFLKALDAANHCGNEDKDKIHCIALGELCDLENVMQNERAKTAYSIAEKPWQLRVQSEKLKRISPVIEQLKRGIRQKTPMTNAERRQLDEAIIHANDFSYECSESTYFDLEQAIGALILSACEKTHNDAQAARADINIGTLLSRIKFRKLGQQLLKDGLAIRRKTLPPFHPDLGRAFSFLGRSQLDWHDPDCGSNLLTAYRIYSSAYGPAGSQTGSVAAALAQYYREKKDHVQMSHYGEIAIQILSSVQPSDVNYDGLMGDLGESYLCLGRLPEAGSAFQSMIDGEERTIDARYAELSLGLRELQAVKAAQGKTAEAEALGARGKAIRWRKGVIQHYLLPQVKELIK
jgi:eukaryotic-like serine/threonine-protein kinase